MLLGRFAEARLLTLDEGTAEVAHEVLIREWPTLRGWLEEDRRAYVSTGGSATLPGSGTRGARSQRPLSRHAACAALEWAQGNPTR